MKETIISWAHSILDLLYPKLCAACNLHLTPSEDIICLHCERRLAKSHFIDYKSNPIEHLFWGRVPIKAAGSIYYFTKNSGIQHMMHLLKYKQRKDVGHWMGRKLGEQLIASGRFDGIDIIIPVPLHPKKEFSRGYNQSEEIGKGIVELTNWKLCNDLQRIDQTESQTRKSKFDRWLNVESAFSLRKNSKIIDKNILIIDDVITTGATLEASVKVLLDGGARSVSVASVASA